MKRFLSKLPLIALVLSAWTLIDAYKPNTCPLGHFCVQDYGTLAAAVTAATNAGGGTVFLSSSVTLSAAQSIGNNIKVECANKGILIGTSSATLDILESTGTNATFTHCGFTYTGGGSKTAGFFINLEGGSTQTVLDDLYMNNPFVGVRIDAVLSHLTDIDIPNPTAGTGAGGVLCEGASFAELKGISVGASSAGVPEFGVKLTGASSTIGCDLAISNSTFLQVTNGVSVKPVANKTVFLHLTNSALDTDTTPVIIQPQGAGAVVGWAVISNSELGFNGGEGLLVDTASIGGSVRVVTATGNIIENEGSNNSGQGINLLGTLGTINIADNSVGGTGNTINTAFQIGASTNCICTVMGNAFIGQTAAISLVSTITHSQIYFNATNGGTISNGGGNSTTACGNGATCSAILWANGS